MGFLAKMESRVFGVLAAMIGLYFLWLDVALYYHVQQTAAGGPSHGRNLLPPFTGLSVKLMAMDHFNNYIFIPMAQLFEQMTEFGKVFGFISPNMISTFGAIVALAAGRCIMSDSLRTRRLAVALFCIRNWLDALDGQVARTRMGLVQHVSLQNTTGFVVDGLADCVGFTAFMIGVFFFLRRTIAGISSIPGNFKDVKYSSLGLPTLEDDRQSLKRVCSVVLCFSATLLLGSFFWNRYISHYNLLLETRERTEAQENVLKSSIFWVLIWFWRVSNCFEVMSFFLFAIFINHLWEFLVWIQYVGLIQIVTLAFLTELHLIYTTHYLTH